MSTYRSKLFDYRWDMRREEILLRDEYRCVNCGIKDKHVDVHHQYYEGYKDPWDYPAEALVTLCRRCHEFLHEMNNERKRIERERGLIE